MSRLAGIHDLAYCFQRLGGAGSAGYAEDWVGLGANLGALAGKAMWYAKGQWKSLVDALAKSGKSVLPTPTAIIDVTMVVVSVVDLFNGFGPPDKGGSFTSGVDKLDNVKLQLEAAVVDPRDWDGDAAKAYTAQLAALQALVETMKDLDKQMQALVANQGAEVQKAHTAISVTLFALVVAQGIALVLYMIPIVGAEISCAWQIVAAFAACATVLAFEMFTLANSMSLGHEINALALEYGDVQKNATLSAAFARIEVAAAQQSTFTSFTAISESMAGMSAFANMPTVSSLARMAGTAGEGAAADAQAKMTALEEPPADGIPEGTPGVPDTGAAPAFTPPTLAQVSAASGQAAKMSGHISQHMNLVNQTMGSVQQVSSMGQQGQQAAAPAEDAAAEGAAPAEAALADDAEGAGAGINTDGAERAPVDLAGGGQSGTSQSERFV
ncbi:EspA/EspE family type VII secretion system effector [Mycobacterium parmense]|uniref:ESX-1 secretion-associated protein EspA/EspE-like domain-containing protein n=1 Tax=Mycobacterium parmense TaxID=185642 RepID=A0A7I7Z1A6_9MYCO|nr:EspA/EspE family type VII secretion system effector [Mycobacterium parmense]MCV7352753.1 hypothetical protein [Mycobacterium parmense]BBZ46761.1 hypothetical protein MPRM_40420 [Mycobacterium parmense]